MLPTRERERERERERDVDDTHAFVPPVFWVVVVMGGGDGGVGERGYHYQGVLK